MHDLVAVMFFGIKNDCQHCKWCGFMETSHEWIEPYCYKKMRVCERITEECQDFEEIEKEDSSDDNDKV